jgi:ankyrin repeat protein
MDPSAKGEQLNGWSPLIFTAKEGHVEMARLLLKHGANSLHKDRLCLTALDGEMVA